jgi:hypothetical protein
MAGRARGAGAPARSASNGATPQPPASGSAATAASSWSSSSPPLRAQAASDHSAQREPAPLPPAAATVLGARRIEVLKRPVAVTALQLGPDRLTYVVQHPHGIPPRSDARTESGLHAITFQRGAFTCVVVGPAATQATWRAAFE